MEKDHVLLVAVGGIGFRHFQALLNCRSDFELHVVDVSEAAIERAKTYEKEQKNRKLIHYYTAISEIEPSLYFRLAIIATSSLVRREVFEELVKGHPVETVLFEKVLFPKVRDYAEVGAILKEKHIAAYVNCARRVQSIYRKLREDLGGARLIQAQIRGGNWGLACNSIHMIDLFAYLSGADTQFVTCNSALLENRIYDSKRRGYIEFYGKLAGRIGENTTYLIECNHSEAPNLIELFTDTDYYCIDEAGGQITVQSLNSGELTEHHFQMSYVSRTTSEIADGLLRGEPVELTRFEESARLHIPLLKEFLNKRNEIQGKEDEICPVT